MPTRENTASRTRSAATVRRSRLRRSDCAGPGVRRVRRGRGFSYLDERGRRLASPEDLARIRELAIPPAWEEVWVCPDPLGHLQATGVDAAGRRQYLYHPRWREHRDREKFERMISFAELLPGLRRRLARTLRGQLEPRREIVLASAVRLLDIGMFRVGSEQYADEDGGIGLATVRKEHVRLRDGAVEFDYPGKGGLRRRQVIEDPVTFELIRTLKRRRAGPDELLAYRDGSKWRDVHSEDINEYLKEQLGEGFSAKDFRTWNATVMAAVTLGADSRQLNTKTARKRAINASVRAVSELLGNTPAVARRSYIDPRVFDRYLSGWTIAAALERIPEPNVADDAVRTRIESAVIDLLVENTESSALEQIPAESTAAA
ncbi:MAG: DNA topoisomerase IB [Solirubrobacterales bacterium]|nr:DNA topoisomerase IB [Solirubrobacterales bacterium]